MLPNFTDYKAASSDADMFLIAGVHTNCRQTDYSDIIYWQYSHKSFLNAGS